MIYDPPMTQSRLIRSTYKSKPIIYDDSDGRKLERYVGCETCKHTSKHIACSYEDSINRCLYNSRHVRQLKAIQYGLPKYNDSYAYALWEPNWNENELPEELFEI